MHLVTFTITVIEILLVFFQVIYFLQRPQDRQRLWYLILLLLLIQYNIAGGLFPDPRLSLPLFYQNLYSYFTGALMSIYLAIYFYKTFKLENLRFIAYYGGFIFIGIPYLIFFVVPYAITGNVELSGRLVAIIPIIYGLTMGWKIFKSFREKLVNASDDEDVFYCKEQMISNYIAFLFWFTLPFVTFFQGSQLLEHSLTNAGFMVMTVFYIRKIVYNSRQEYITLKKSESSLVELSTSLQVTVKEKTNHLEKLIQQKTNTFINLAHELKTPVTLTQNYLNDYEKKYGSTKELEIIKSATNKIARDVVNFFDLEKFNKGGEVYENENITNFSQVLSLSIELFTLLASKKSIQIKSSIEPDLYIKSDPAALERIIYNLIENAIKYTDQNKAIFVKLSSDDHKLIFTVYDEGIGIRKEQIKNIFDPYFQINSKKRSLDGMGMGLSIVKQIVKQLSGKISVNSEPGKGSTFQIIFNRHSLSNNWEIPEHTVSNNTYIDIDTEPLEDIVVDEERPYVMVVEDNVQLLRFLREMLSVHYNVYAATDGAHALEKLAKNIPIDLIVSDIMMDVVSGYKLFEHVSKTHRYSHLPFIFLTAKTGQEAKEKGHLSGAVGYIEKPFHFGLLKAQIDSILQNRNRQQQKLLKKVLHHDNGSVFQDERDWFTVNCDRFVFTQREKEISGLLIKGVTSTEISKKLGIAPNTVKTHIRNIYEKAVVKSKIQLAKKLEGRERSEVIAQ